MSRLSDPNSDRLFLSIADRLKRRMTRDRVPASDCEDCVQQVWVALLEVHPDWSLDEPRTMAWLLTVARNKSLDFHRQRLRHPNQRIDDLDAVPFSDPLQEIEEEVAPDIRRQTFISSLHDALTQVSDVNREILISRLQGETFGQIGNAVGLTTNLVRARYHRVLHKLQGDIENMRAKMNDSGGGELLCLWRSLLIPDPPARRRSSAAVSWRHPMMA